MKDYTVTKTVTYEAVIRDADDAADALAAAKEDDELGGSLFAPVSVGWEVEGDLGSATHHPDGIVLRDPEEHATPPAIRHVEKFLD